MSQKIPKLGVLLDYGYHAFPSDDGLIVIANEFGRLVGSYETLEAARAALRVPEFVREALNRRFYPGPIRLEDFQTYLSEPQPFTLELLCCLVGDTTKEAGMFLHPSWQETLLSFDCAEVEVEGDTFSRRVLGVTLVLGEVGIFLEPTIPQHHIYILKGTTFKTFCLRHRIRSNGRGCDACKVNLPSG